ncbi:hypothetical protein P280DRAFT_477653 [Massarina eburnea CBS 473.64]|uniref:RING-type domain-containing protein n=1 Tax=Massarina eburnea CBS 473.64 TaxID=1395130 RepID=A0A6A6S955_9PLEO|nr:hypothetical protein P280DRAFT_477653 [Massarina eburnea CBS 473.64]
MPSSSHARGSTPSASRSSLTSLKAADSDRPARAASKDSLKQKMGKKTEDAPRPAKSDETQHLHALRTEFDVLRTHLTCKICDRLLYQPFTIACGHTYCYSCLCIWFVNNKARKTCPDCRTVVNQPPAPAYVIREMTGVFIGRAELLPQGETIEQHSKWQKEEADSVQQDKDNTDSRNGGLFKGCFRSAHLARGSHSLHAIRDQDDGVDRCPICSWELEEGECVQCGLVFDDNGELTWTDSFTGFSDMDEMSEQDMSGEDMDAEMDMEDADYDAYGPPEGWGEYYPEEGNFMMQRFLEHGIPAHAAFARRRPMSHSEAGSRRSYTQSVVSDMYTDEMDTVQEEDEEELDEDSSMNDFLDDEAESASSQSAESTLSQTPRPSGARGGVRARNRPVVESEPSSTISSVVEEDEEDAGPIRRGQRNRAQTRILNRANGSREAAGPPSATSTDVSVDELDEDTQALLQSDGWELQHNGPDDQDEDEDDDSDGGRTTVGWDATAISNDRARMGGSLTPTADRPRPNGTIRPPSRVGNPLRRRSTVPPAAVNYEDGEADDDDSDPDHDGDVNMAMNSLRNRRSRVHMRNPAAFQNYNNRLAGRGGGQGIPNDADADNSSDNSQPEDQRRARRQEYNPRISRLFADHQRALLEIQGGQLLDLEPRSITPITRPRTANRNRPSPAQAFSPFMAPAPARLRTPNMNNTSNPAINNRGPASPPRRTAPPYSLSTAVNADMAANGQRVPSNPSANNASSAGLPPGTSTPSSQRLNNIISDGPAGAAVEIGDRPPSRVGARPPSATGRRNSAGFSPVYSNFPPTNVGLNIQGRIFPHQALGNPWGAFVQPRGVRVRNSRQLLREQSSTATLRPASSRVNLREGPTSPPGVRTQASRIDLRPQPSRRRLNNQSSTRTLRASEHARPPQSPAAPTAAAAQSAPRPTRLTQEETSARARELVNNRMLALGQSGTVPSRNNPFVQGFRRPDTAESTASSGTANASHHSRSNSNESLNSGSSHTTSMTPPSPRLARQRSVRHIGAAPPGAASPPAGAFQAPTSTYSNNYLRSRQSPLGNSAFDMPLDANTRGISPMMATSLI